MSGYRRRGTSIEPRAQLAVVERHVRARYSLPVFASLVTLAFVAVTAVPGTTTAQAEARVEASQQAPQSLVVAGQRLASEVRESGYSVTDPPKATAPASGIPDPDTAQAIAYQMVADIGWSVGEYDCLVALWNRESRWNVYAENKSSGAYGIPQALPGNKMASVADDWQTNPATQITWGLGYIQGRYGTPCGAWAQSQAKGWY